MNNPACKGIFGPINISNVVALPTAFPLESMHAICLGLLKRYNTHFFSSQNKDQTFYLGKLSMKLLLYFKFFDRCIFFYKEEKRKKFKLLLPSLFFQAK